MKNIIVVGTGILVSLLWIGSFATHDDVFQWAAATSIGFQVARIVIVGFLIALLIQKPPRKIWFRAMLGVAAIVLAVAAPVLLLSYAMHVLDAAVCIEVAIIFAIEALEVETKKAPSLAHA